MKLIDPNTTYIDPRAEIADDVVIYPNNHIIGACKIASGCVLYPNNILTDTQIGCDCKVTASVAERACVGQGATVGPYAYLRPGSKIGDGCRIGDFVEIKNAAVGDATKVSHLTYVGDCEIGKRCNIGCGVVFVNYDGVAKHRSTVGDDCFIGSNCNVVAPVRVADQTYVAAGTTLVSDTPSDSLVIGRVRAEIKPDRASQLKRKFRLRKESEGTQV